MSEVFDVLIVGAGPGGLAAAATAAEAGKRVCLVDDNPEAGGQIWRRDIAKSHNDGPVAQWLLRIGNEDVVMMTGCRAVGGFTGGVEARADASSNALLVERNGEREEIKYSSLILAPGARELFLPFPGWTMTGVYGVGGLQAFVKSGLDITDKRVVIAGTGPLLLAVAAALRKAGARVIAVFEQASLSRLIKFSLNLVVGHTGKLIEGAGYRLSCFGMPYYTDGWVTAAVGEDRLWRVSAIVGGCSFEIEADILATGYHLVPNVELAQLLNCKLKAGYVSVDDMQQTSVRGIYCIGEATGIGGVDKAQVEGQVAALAAVGRVEQAETLVPERDSQRRFVRKLADTFQLRDELRGLATAETVVCRCEDVSQRSLVHCRSWREAKLHTRCGMGPCQGRCSDSVSVWLGLADSKAAVVPCHSRKSNIVWRRFL
jgi:NADPH-dependent 2,4-dienoyl-CoA reductase/sulfur reductase-like enzyme